MEKTNKVQVGERIKQIRLSLGESMEQFGKRFNTSKGTVNNWEKGRNLPNKENLKKIASLQNREVGELLHGDYVEKIFNTLKNVTWIYNLENNELYDLSKKIYDNIIEKYGYFYDFSLPDVDITDYISFSLNNLLTDKKVFEISPHCYYKINKIPTYYIENEDTENSDLTISSFTHLDIIFNDYEDAHNLDRIQIRYSTLLKIDFIISNKGLKKIVFEGLEKIESPQYSVFFNSEIVHSFKKSITEQILEFVKKDYKQMFN